MDVHAGPRPGLSVIDAASEAIDLARVRLFPFRFDRWLALGFVAFLDACGRKGGGGGTGGGYQFPGSGPGGVGPGGGADFSSVQDWIRDHLAVLLAGVAVALVLCIALAALILWINSRGVFMYIDNVSTGRFDVKRPWAEHRESANSYFKWSFGLAMVGLLGVLVMLVPIGFLVFAMFTKSGNCAVMGGIAALGLVLVAWIIALNCFSVLLRDFAAPLQLVLGVPCGHAVTAAWGLVKANVAPFVVYILLKIVFAIVFGILALIAGCLTCCLGFLPVIAQTLLQPIYYFERAWSLFLLRQAGYDPFTALAPQLLPEQTALPPLPGESAAG